MSEKKVAQSRYCPNSSNEGQGIWRGNYWICMPCFEEFRITLEKKEAGK